jgi:hypothetical protein
MAGHLQVSHAAVLSFDPFHLHFNKNAQLKFSAPLLQHTHCFFSFLTVECDIFRSPCKVAVMVEGWSAWSHLSFLPLPLPKSLPDTAETLM